MYSHEDANGMSVLLEDVLLSKQMSMLHVFKRD